MENEAYLKTHVDTHKHKAVPPEFAEKVDKLLPPQPWKSGIHLQIAKTIGCNVSEVSDAIQSLIAIGKEIVKLMELSMILMMILLPST